MSEIPTADPSKPAFRVLAENRASKKIMGRSGVEHPFQDLFTEDVGLLLYDLIRREKPQEILELGLLHATSALYMLQALADNGSGRMVSADPYQNQVDYAGVEAIKRAGFGNIHEHVELPSEMAMPIYHMQIQQRERQRFDMVFIDTNHQFDQTILELFYADKITKEGGYVVLDDYRHSAVKTACNFWEANRHYFRDPLMEVEGRNKLENLLILEKFKDDDRQWWHFAPFPVNMTPYKGGAVRVK